MHTYIISKYYNIIRYQLDSFLCFLAAQALGPLLERYGVGEEDVIELQAGEFEALLGDLPAASMSGGVSASSSACR